MELTKVLFTCIHRWTEILTRKNSE